MADVSLKAARALIARVVELEDETVTNGILIGLRDDPDWLQLPPAKREAALRRYKVLRAYDRKKAPTKAEAAAAAQELGLQLRSFYALLRDWRDKRKSVLALVPYRSNEDKPRTSRLDPAVAKQLIEQVRALLKENPSVTPGNAVRDVEKTWRKDLKRPSDVTVRTYVDRERTEHAAEPGTLRLNVGDAPYEQAETASRFGEVLVIDHTSPARLLLDGDEARAPTITLAIDLWSGVPIGAAISDGEPDAEGVLDALADAWERMDEIGKDVTIQPRLVYASTPTSEWGELREELLSEGFELVERRDHRLHFGGPIKRILGAKLGGIALHASKARRSAVDRIDPEQDTLLSLNEMQFVVDSAVDRLIEERLPAVDGRRGTRLHLPPWLSDRSSLRGRTGPLIRLEVNAGENSGNEGVARTRDQRPVGSVSADPFFQHELIALVGEILGRLVVCAEVQAPSPMSPGWAVDLAIDDGRHLAEAWLALAREAVEIAEVQGEMVRFNIVVEPGKAVDRQDHADALGDFEVTTDQPMLDHT